MHLRFSSHNLKRGRTPSPPRKKSGNSGFTAWGNDRKDADYGGNPVRLTVKALTSAVAVLLRLRGEPDLGSSPAFGSQRPANNRITFWSLDLQYINN
ncbi:hypothetical protein J6590_058601 [Homalodisca vitripennis]|nr:hypothetical protein J6590_058601 [Homalodisca vitripennis]